jgi:hypothetical protein
MASVTCDSPPRRAPGRRQCSDIVIAWLFAVLLNNANTGYSFYSNKLILQFQGSSVLKTATDSRRNRDRCAVLFWECTEILF